MTNNSALFLVQTPLHIHNAHEAIVKFSIDKATFLVVTSKHQAKWANMMVTALPTNVECLFCERNDFDIEACTQSYMQHMPWLLNQGFDYVFFCDTRLYIFTDIVKRLANPNTYLMDDGAATIISIHILQQFGHYFEEYQSSVAERRLQIEQVKRKHNIWNLPQVKYNLFTAFDFESCEQFDVIQNPMQRLSSVHSKTNDDCVLFIGQPLANSGYVSDETYANYLNAIRGFYRHKRVLYLPHPREAKNNVFDFSKRTGLDIVETELSAEAYLMNESTPPSTVCGFYSTALWMIAKFHHGIQVDAHRLLLTPSNISQKKHISRSNHLSELDCIDLYYQYYQQRMNVIEPLLELKQTL